MIHNMIYKQDIYSKMLNSELYSVVTRKIFLQTTDMLKPDDSNYFILIPFVEPPISYA